MKWGVLYQCGDVNRIRKDANDETNHQSIAVYFSDYGRDLTGLFSLAHPHPLFTRRLARLFGQSDSKAPGKMARTAFFECEPYRLHLHCPLRYFVTADYYAHPATNHDPSGCGPQYRRLVSNQRPAASTRIHFFIRY